MPKLLTRKSKVEKIMTELKIGLGSYAICKPTHIIVQVISSPYKNTQEKTVADVRLVFDPYVTFTADVEELEVIQELE